MLYDKHIKWLNYFFYSRWIQIRLIYLVIIKQNDRDMKNMCLERQQTWFGCYDKNETYLGNNLKQLQNIHIFLFLKESITSYRSLYEVQLSSGEALLLFCLEFFSNAPSLAFFITSLQMFTFILYLMTTLLPYVWVELAHGRIVQSWQKKKNYIPFFSLFFFFFFNLFGLLWFVLMDLECDCQEKFFLHSSLMSPSDDNSPGQSKILKILYS